MSGNTNRATETLRWLAVLVDEHDLPLFHVTVFAHETGTIDVRCSPVSGSDAAANPSAAVAAMRAWAAVTGGAIVSTAKSDEFLLTVTIDAPTGAHVTVDVRVPRATIGPARQLTDEELAAELATTGGAS